QYGLLAVRRGRSSPVLPTSRTARRALCDARSHKAVGCAPYQVIAHSHCFAARFPGKMVMMALLRL
ncbi:MAG: hypothetical protein PVF04_02055, partial [Anaerolineae bacterium]